MSKEHKICGARLADGSRCTAIVEPGKTRCYLHGGLSTGPKTPEGKARISAAMRAAWAERKELIALGREVMESTNAQQ